MIIWDRMIISILSFSAFFYFYTHQHERLLCITIRTHNSILFCEFRSVHSLPHLYRRYRIDWSWLVAPPVMTFSSTRSTVDLLNILTSRLEQNRTDRPRTHLYRRRQPHQPASVNISWPSLCGISWDSGVKKNWSFFAEHIQQHTSIIFVFLFVFALSWYDIAMLLDVMTCHSEFLFLLIKPISPTLKHSTLVHC